MGLRYAVLLRGVNVGAAQQVPMPRLRELLATAGLADVETYLRSGNVVAAAGDVADDPDAVAACVRDTVRRGLGTDVPVLVRTHEQLVALLAADPFPGADPARTSVSFCSPPARPQDVEALRSRAGPHEGVAVAGGEIWLHQPDGIAGSRLQTAPPPRDLVVTARNLRTVRRLAEMTAPRPT